MICSDSSDNESGKEDSVGTSGFSDEFDPFEILRFTFLCNSYIVHDWFCADK